MPHRIRIAASGERNHNHRLTWREFRELRARYRAGTSPRTLPLEYRVSRSTIYQVVGERTWRPGTESPDSRVSLIAGPHRIVVGGGVLVARAQGPHSEQPGVTRGSASLAHVPDRKAWREQQGNAVAAIKRPRRISG